MKVSVALLSYARQYHLPAIVENLRRFPEVDDLVLFQNVHPPTEETLALGFDKVIYSEENQFTYGRFLAMRQCRRSTVVTQDDDITFSNLPALIEAYEQADGKAAICNLAQDGFSRHWQFWQDFKPGYNLLGFGSIMPKRFGEILDRWPFDPALKQRKADVIVTACHPTASLQAGRNDLARLRYRDCESGRDGNALWLRRDHKALTEECLRAVQRWVDSGLECPSPQESPLA